MTQHPTWTFAVALGLAACGGEVADETIPSPDTLPAGAADGTGFSERGRIAYGARKSDRIATAGSYHGWTFDALAGATLGVQVARTRPVSVFGPLDREHRWGPAPIAAATGPIASFAIPEDGRYAVVVGGRRGSYAVTLGCAAGCEVDPDSGKRLVHAVDRASLPADLRDYVREHGFVPDEETLRDLGGDPARDSLLSHRAFFSPNGGWAASNRALDAFVLRAPGGTVTWEPAGVVHPTVDLFRRAREEILVAMYGFSLSVPEGQELLAAAARGVAVKVYLDISETDPNGVPYTQGTIATLLATPNVEVRVPRRSSKTMHEKFGIVDGRFVFDGSANISRKAAQVYTEDRFFFLHSPAVVAQFASEWTQLWDQDGRDARDL